MNSYIMNFAVYSFAIMGFFVALLLVYKKAVNSDKILNKKNFLKVESTLKLSPVKSIYVIKAGNERFLIAGDTSNTTMLAKLEDNQENEEYIDNEDQYVSISPLKMLKKSVRS